MLERRRIQTSPEEIRKARKRYTNRQCYLRNRESINMRSAKRWAELWKNDPDKARAIIGKSQRKHRDRRHVDVSIALECMMRNARARSARRNLDCNISLEYLRQVYDLQGGVCAITAMPFEQTTDYGKMSLDRIDPSCGYVQGNIRIVWLLVNNAMGVWGEGPLLRVAEAIVERNLVRNQPK